MFSSYILGETRHIADNVYQLLAHGRWFSPGTPASSTTKTGRYGIAVELGCNNRFGIFKDKRYMTSRLL
jgi:hypothetical protein